MSGDGSEPGVPRPSDEWLARYDDALMRGETPPDPADAPGSGFARFRDFLDRLDRTLRPGRGGDGPSTIAEGDEEAGGDGEEQLPETIGRFRIEKRLGSGGFGIVYRAFDPSIGRQLALKVPKADAVANPRVRRDFLREAHAAAQLDHPNLVPVFEVGEAGSVCYIASAYCEGPTLLAWIKGRDAAVEPRAAGRLALKLARAIEHMHARGLFHCDLKPANVLLDLHAEEEPTPRVTDFGLARLADAPVGESTAARLWGTPPYMAPEQIETGRTQVGPAADVYALGAILYELLTGRPPHRGETTWALMQAVVSEHPSPPRSVRRAVPHDLDAIAMRCLEKRPDRRYPDAGALAEDLASYLGGNPTKARPLGRVRRLARWSARNPAAAGLLVLGATTLVVSLSYSLALRRAVDDLNRANGEAGTARDLAEQHEGLARDALARAERKAEEERRANYVATLALAQQEMDHGRLVQAQRTLRDLIPSEGDGGPDRRDFAWHYLWRQSRRECTVLDDLAVDEGAYVSVADGLLFATQPGRSAGAWRLDRFMGDSSSSRPERSSMTFRSLSTPKGNLSRLAVPADGRFGVGILVDGSSEGEDPKTAKRFALTAVDLSDGSVRGTFNGGPLNWSRTDSIAAAVDGKRVAIGLDMCGPSKLVTCDWDFGNDKVQVILVPCANATAGVAISGDGRRIATLPSYKEEYCYLRVWDVMTGGGIDVGVDVVPFALAISPDSRGLVATGTHRGEVQLYDPVQGEVTSVLSAPEGYRDITGCRCLAFSPDGQILAAGYSGIAVLWDVQRRLEIARIEGLEGRTWSIAFMGGSPRDVAIGVSSGEVVVWHAKPIDPAVVLKGHTDQVWGVGYAEGGRTLVTLGGDKFLKLWDAATDAELASLPGHRDFPSCLAATMSGRLVATGDFSGEVLIWDVGDRRLVHRLKAHKDRVRAVAVTADGRWVASGGRDRTVRLWDARSGAAAGSIDGFEGSIRTLAFQPGGRMLAMACEDGAIRLCDVEDQREKRRLDVSVNACGIVWSPDGRIVAAGDVRGTVTLWDAETGDVRARLAKLHRDEVSGLAFSPDGRVLAVAGQDKLITLIDVATGRRHLTLAGHEGGVNALAFSPDGRTLASASHDKTVRLWWAGPPETSTLSSSKP